MRRIHRSLSVFFMGQGRLSLRFKDCSRQCQRRERGSICACCSSAPKKLPFWQYSGLGSDLSDPLILNVLRFKLQRCATAICVSQKCVRERKQERITLGAHTNAVISTISYRLEIETVSSAESAPRNDTVRRCRMLKYGMLLYRVTSTEKL